MMSFFSKYLNTDIKLSRSQFIGMVGFICVFSGVFGWLYEFIFYFFNDGMERFYWQGGNFLPWINIYAIGAIMILFLSFRYRKNPFIVFLIAFFSTGLLEYISGLVFYEYFGLRFWDYNTEMLNFGNIGGFVCLRSVTFFAMSALFLMYFIVPIFYWLSIHVSVKKFLIVGITLFSIIMFDELYNLVFSRVLGTPRAHDVYKSIGFFD